MLLVLKLIWLMMPAYFANMTPVLTRNLFKKLAFPLDLGKTFQNKRIFGDHKTFRGFFFGIIAAVVIYYIQQILFDFSFFQQISLINYDHYIFFGFWLGIGALTFDILKSFFKRRINIPPGKSWFVFDQLDYVVGALFFMFFYYFPGWAESILILFISFILTILVKHLGYLLKISEEKW